MKKVYFFSTVNPEDEPYATALHNVEEMKVLKDGYCMVIVNGHHQRHSVEMLRKGKGMGGLRNHCVRVTHF